MVELVLPRRSAAPGGPGLALAALGVLLLCWACPRGNTDSESGGTGGGGGSAGSSSLPSDSEKRLDQLTHAELQSYCQDLNEELSTRFDNRRLVNYDCTRQFIQSGDTQSCSVQANECLATSTQASITAPRPPDFQIDNSECDNIGRCQLPLGVFDTCIGDRFDQSAQLIARVSCSLANDPAAVNQLLQQIDNNRQLPQSCVAVVGSCPDLL